MGVDFSKNQTTAAIAVQNATAAAAAAQIATLEEQMSVNRADVDKVGRAGALYKLDSPY